jgi:hypothetical protein
MVFLFPVHNLDIKQNWPIITIPCKMLSDIWIYMSYISNVYWLTNCLCYFNYWIMGIFALQHISVESVICSQTNTFSQRNNITSTLSVYIFQIFRVRLFNCLTLLFMRHSFIWYESLIFFLSIYLERKTIWNLKYFCIWCVCLLALQLNKRGLLHEYILFHLSFYGLYTRMATI